MIRLQIALFVLVLSGISFGEEQDYKVFSGRDRNYPSFEVPADFQLERFSGQDEANKWKVAFVSPDKSLRIVASPYGYVSDMYREKYGYESPRDVVLIENLNLKSVRLELNGIEVFKTAGESSVQFIYMDPEAPWGRCYNLLMISYAEEDRDKVGALIDRVAESFIPTFVSDEDSPREDQ